MLPKLEAFFLRLLLFLIKLAKNKEIILRIYFRFNSISIIPKSLEKNLFYLFTNCFVYFYETIWSTSF